MSTYDVAVIGSGPGGYVAAIRAAQLGLKVACIEKEKALGGTCLNIGCIPSKALLEASAHFAFLTHHAKDFGILCDAPHLNLSQMMKKKEEAVKASSSGIDYLFKKNKIDRITGKARLLSPNSLEVVNGNEKEQLTAKNIILATGSEPISLPFLPIDEKTVLTSTGALSLEKVPKELVVIGGGVIGVELASVYSRLGAKVTVVEMLNQICTPLDPTLSHLFLQILQRQKITFLLQAKVTEAKKQGEEIVIKVEHEGKVKELKGDAVLVAVGRRPFTEGLGVETLNITLHKGFVSVDAHFRTSIPSIYAIGDLIDGPMLAHRASEEGVAVAEIIAGKQVAAINYIAIPNVIYTHPEVATVGLTEQEAKEAKLDVMVGICPFRANPRARCAGETEGQVKVIGDKRSGRLLGVHIIGVNASEMIGEIVLAMEKKMNVTDLADLVHAHPTRSEAIKEACLQALGRAIHL